MMGNLNYDLELMNSKLIAVLATGGMRCRQKKERRERERQGPERERAIAIEHCSRQVAAVEEE